MTHRCRSRLETRHRSRQAVRPTARSARAAAGVVGAAALLLMALPAQGGTVTPGSLGVPHKLNLVVTSDYDIESPEDLEPVFTTASRTLYDATEKQMQLGQVTFYNNCPAMRDRADVVIVGGSNKMWASTNTGNTRPAFKIPGYHIHMGEDRLKRPRPGRSLAHEIGHYAFNLRDEYSAVVDPELAHVQTRHEDPLLPFVDEPRAYCNQPGYVGTTSLMVIGPDIAGPTEFCTKAHQGWGTDHHEGHVFSSISMDLSSLGPHFAGRVQESWYVMVNDQEHAKHRSCWEQVAAMSTAYLGALMFHPMTEPVAGDTAGHQGIEWKVEPCASTIVFVIDRSGSMSNDARLAWAKSQANNSIDLLEDGTQVGAVVFSDNAASLFDIEPLDEDSRAAMHLKIMAISSGGATNIGGGLLHGLGMLQARDPREGAEAIVLLTDGEHTTGTPPEQVVPQLVAEGVAVQIVGVGDDVDVSSLTQLSDNTGGRALFVSGTQDQAPALTELALEAHGSKPMRTWKGSLQASESLAHELWVDEYTSQVVFFLSTPLHAGALELRDPAGALVDDSEPGVDLLLDGQGQTLRVQAPAVGRWTLTATAPDNALTDVGYRLVAYDRSTRVNVVTNVLGGILGSTVVAVPEPIHVQTQVFGGGDLVAGAVVTAEITHPDQQISTIELHDDGQPEHGDSLADDGVYNALFFRYGPMGQHDVVVHVDAQDGRTSTVGMTDHDGAEVESRPVARFERTSELSTFVLGFPGLLVPGALSVAQAAGPALPEGRAVPAGAPKVPMASMRVVVDSKEYVVLSSATVTDSGDGDLAEVGTVRLYMDGDEDGYPDSSGEWVEPIAKALFDIESRTVTFEDVSLPPNGELDLLVTYDFAGSLEDARMAALQGGAGTRGGEASESRAADGAAPVERRPRHDLPLAALALALMAAAVVARQRRRQLSRRPLRLVLVPAAAALLFGAASCSDDDGSESPAPVSTDDAVVVPTSISTYRAQVDPSAWSAVGATTDEAVAVSGSAIQGPVMTVGRFDH